MSPLKCFSVELVRSDTYESTFRAGISKSAILSFLAMMRRGDKLTITRTE